MMRSQLVILAMCSLSVIGCGTFSDTMCGPIAVSGHNPVFYRGVRLDIEGVKEGGPMVLMAADIPFSAVADTLLIPYLACLELTLSKSRQSVTDEKANSNKGMADSLAASTPNQ